MFLCTEARTPLCLSAFFSLPPSPFSFSLAQPFSPLSFRVLVSHSRRNRTRVSGTHSLFLPTHVHHAFLARVRERARSMRFAHPLRGFVRARHATTRQRERGHALFIRSSILSRISCVTLSGENMACRFPPFFLPSLSPLAFLCPPRRKRNHAGATRYISTLRRRDSISVSYGTSAAFVPGKMTEIFV